LDQFLCGLYKLVQLEPDSLWILETDFTDRASYQKHDLPQKKDTFQSNPKQKEEICDGRPSVFSWSFVAFFSRFF